VFSKIKKLQNSITLVCVDSINPYKALRVVEYCNEKFKFDRAILFTCDHSTKSKDIEIIYTKNFNLTDYNTFLLKELNDYIKTDYCLIIQTDGFILNPKLWNDDFLNYDFIGAPLSDFESWLNLQNNDFIEKWKKNNFDDYKWPQNGGFSLRTKKLLKASAECPFPVIDIAEDNYINVYHREWFEMKGLKFAPKDLAYEFSVENPLKNYKYDFKNCFGFHGKQTKKHLDLIKNIGQKKSHFFIINKLFNIPEKLSAKEFFLLKLKNKKLGLDRNDFFRLYRDYQYNQSLKANNTNIAVVICCIDKDDETLPKCIESVRQYLNHPIKNIYLVAPCNSLKIKQIAENLSCIFVNEETILEIKKEDIKYIVNGKDRSGWIFQQLLKLHADKISNSDNIFVIDADTILIQPKTLISNGKTIFDFSDEYHYPYFKALNRLCNFDKISSVSFVSHMMTFNRFMLINLRKDISDFNKKPFIKSILEILDENENSCFSEFELYGNFYINNSRNFIFEYWNNQSLNRQNLSALDFYTKLFEPSGTESLSFHNYEQK
jgi:hypothetical protein